ncbi:tyrosine-protein phosphatase [Halobacillus sp. H74]|uniref:tyrosine-protein phosphatase n=1 Tax=Halobacillus sp. H74 TaxID=3457436 RepID=UPI003FCE03C0
MIDLNCHILPGMDDGPRDKEESLKMAEAAVQQGIDTIVAAPHHLNSRYDNKSQAILEQCAQLNDTLYQEGIELKVLPGQEVRMHGELSEAIDSGDILPMNQNSGYIYIGFPQHEVPHYAKQVLYDIQLDGYKPVIVHPERNRILQQQPELLYHFVKNGAITQITAGSLVGKYGREPQKLAYQMIEYNLAHLVASNASATKKHQFYMKEAYNKISKKYGAGVMYRYMENAHVVLEGEMVYTAPPERIRTKKRLGIF